MNARAQGPETEEILIKARDVVWNKVTVEDILTFDLIYRKFSGLDARASLIYSLRVQSSENYQSRLKVSCQDA